MSQKLLLTIRPVSIIEVDGVFVEGVVRMVCCSEESALCDLLWVKELVRSTQSLMEACRKEFLWIFIKRFLLIGPRERILMKWAYSFWVLKISRIQASWFIAIHSPQLHTLDLRKITAFKPSIIYAWKALHSQIPWYTTILVSYYYHLWLSSPSALAPTPGFTNRLLNQGFEHQFLH
jgi:hypothetical protein